MVDTLQSRELRVSKLFTIKELERLNDLFGKDTTLYSVVLREGNDITHTYFTGLHVQCLVRMKCLLNSKEGQKFTADYHMDLLNNETGRLMSWSV